MLETIIHVTKWYDTIGKCFMAKHFKKCKPAPLESSKDFSVVEPPDESELYQRFVIKLTYRLKLIVMCLHARVIQLFSLLHCNYNYYYLAYIILVDHTFVE